MVPALLLACFGRLVVHPTGLLVDPNRPSVDHNVRSFEPPTVGNDATRLFIPHHAAIARHVARLGRVPAWDDRGFGGRPLVGNPQAGLSYPPIWLAWRAWSPALLGWTTLTHLLFAALGTYVLARSVGTGVQGAVVAAGCFSMSPYVLAQAFEGHIPHVWGATWFPWAFWLSIRARRGDFRSGLILAIVLALALLAGHPQEPLLLLLALALGEAGSLARLVATRQARPADLARRVGVGSIVLGFVLGLTAVEWLPVACVAPWTLRSGPLSAAVAGRYHLFPSNLVQLLSPFALGGPSDFLGHDNYWEALTAMGLIPLALALIAVIWGRERRVIRGWILLSLGAVWFAAGRQLGLFSFLHQVAPGLDRFRVPARSLFLASLGASVLAGFGVDTLRRLADDPDGWIAWSRQTRRAVLALAILVGVASLATLLGSARQALGPGELTRILQGFARAGSEPAFWGALFGLVMIVQLGRTRPHLRPMLAGALGLLGLIELATYGNALLMVAPAEQFVGHDPMTRAIADDRTAGSLPARIRAVDSWFDDLRAQTHGLQKTNLNDSFQIRHAARVYEPLYRIFAPDPSIRDRPLDVAVGEYRRTMRQQNLDQLGVEYLVANRSPLDPRWIPLDQGEWRGTPFLVARNPTALPRARFVVSLPSDDRGPGRPATWLRSEPDRIRLRLTSEGPGSLTIAETWMPGWTARVDGRPVRVAQTPFAQCQIPITSAGTHTVDLQYEAPGRTLANTITAATTLAWITLWRMTRRSRTRIPEGSTEVNPDNSGPGR